MPRATLLALLALAAAAAQLCHVHVVHPSSSLPPGATPASAFATISAAQAALRSGAARRAAAGPTRVCIHAGAYAETLTFTAADSGAGPHAPIIYTAAPGAQNVSVTGAVPITLLPLPPNDPVRALLPPAVAAQVLVADLAAAGVPGSAATWHARGFGYGGCQVSPLELTIDGVVQRTARWPNPDDGSQGTTRGFALTAWHAPSQGLSNGSLWVRTNDGSAPWLTWSAASLASLQLHGFWHFEWADGYVGSAGVVETDGDMVRVGFVGPVAEGALNSTIGAARYYVTNALEALDEAGEYWVNATAGRLYVYGDGSSSSGAAAVSVNTTLVTFLQGTSDVWLAGITLEGARGHGIELTGTRGIALLNLTLRNLGQDGVTSSFSNDTLVAGAQISDMGCAGVRFTGGGDRLTLTPSGNAVVDSVVTRVERLCYTYNPAVALDTGGLAAHNELHDAPHNCVTLDGNDVSVLGNLIHNCTRLTFDNAAVYWYPTAWSKRNTTLRHNFLYLNAQDANTCNAATSCNRDAIYPDNGSAGVLVESNVIYHPRPAASNLPCPNCNSVDKMVSYAVFEDGTRDAVQRNNIMVLDGSNGTFNGAAGVVWDKAQQGNASAYIADLRAVQWDSGIYAERYPELATLEDFWPAGGALACAANERCGAAPYGNVITTNVIVGAEQVLTPPPAPYFFSAMFNVSNNLVTADPGWANADARGSLNFTLAPGSPAWALGFERIPTECFGPGRRCPGEPDWGKHARDLVGGT